MRISLAYEMGILRRPDLNQVQRWALARYLYDQREMRRLELKNQAEEISFFSNPDLFKIIHFPDQDAPDDEVSEEVGTDEFEDIDKYLAGLDNTRHSQEVFNNGDWM